jgi:signal transduction histidine kinase
MYNGLLHTHNLMRWIILVLLLAVIFQAFTRSQGIKKASLFLLIASHLTFLIGIYQWFSGNFGFKLIKEVGMKDVMKNSALRFWAVEHITGMLIAIVLITIARRHAKLASPNYRAAGLLYLVALIIILAVIPWPFREAVARPWFPGMKL